jgi:hypothetical protein
MFGEGREDIVYEVKNATLFLSAALYAMLL